MSRYLRLFLSAAAVLISQPVKAEGVHDGVTFAELTAALSAAKLTVTTDKVEGRDILYAQGKNHTIGAFLVHCGDSTRCEGVKYLAVLSEKLSTTYANSFNRRRNYSKIILDDQGTAVISVELLAVGGVADENLVQNSLGLMYRMTQLKQEMIQASAKPPQPPAATLSHSALLAARAEEAWVGPPKPQPSDIDPALKKAVAESAKIAD